MSIPMTDYTSRGDKNHLVNSNSSSSSNIDSADTIELLDVAQETDHIKEIANKKIEEAIKDKILRDNSPEAKAGRRRMLYRAAFGELMCSILFYAPIFCTITNGYVSGWGSTLTGIAAAFVSGFQAIAISFAFSSVSGAQFNPAISFALWLTGKLSNRRVILYIIVQNLASIIAMIVVSCLFHGDLSDIFSNLALVPGDDRDLGKVFSTEFFLTFFLTYVAFTVAFEDAENMKKENMSIKTISDSKGLTLYASTPQSKTGFAPFAIGFTIFSLNLIGGSSGGAFNPGRLLGPAIFSGKFDYIYLYWLGQFLGAATAGLMVNNMHRIGLTQQNKDEVSAKEIIDKAVASGVVKSKAEQVHSV